MSVLRPKQDFENEGDLRTRLQSPLRYPGGKSALSNFISQILQLNELENAVYCEPFAGGAGAALKLLSDKKVSSLILNDADYRIYAFWKSALQKTQQFVDRIHAIDLSLEEWRIQQEICRHPSKYKMFEIGFAAFYMNRCNRSGIILGAGPIGGYEQSGTAWHMGVRFNRHTLAGRINEIAKYKALIKIYNKDAITLLRDVIDKQAKREDVFVYLDPPYYSAGRRLYMNHYVDDNHKALSRYLKTARNFSWIMSYDNEEFIRNLYQHCDLHTFSLRYSLQTKQEASELLIVPKEVCIPSYMKIGQRDVLIKNAA